MDCHCAREAMYRVSDNELETEQLSPFREHLARCPPCDRYFAYVSRLLALVRSSSCRYAAPSTLRVRILASLPHRGGVVLERVE